MERPLPGTLSKLGVTVSTIESVVNSTVPSLFLNETGTSESMFNSKDLPFVDGGRTRDEPLGDHGDDPKGIYSQPQFELYDNEKGFFYYFFNILCVLSIIFAISMNSFLLELLIRRWKALIKRPFFFLLFVFCVVNLLSATCSVVTEVPVVTFLESYSADNKTSQVADYTFTPLYTIFYNLKLVCEQMVQYLNLLIALLRFVVFVLPFLEEKVFHPYMIYIHVAWTLAASMVLVSYLYAFSCYLRYEPAGYVNFGCYALNAIDAAPVMYWYYATTFIVPAVDFLLYLIILIKFLVVRRVARSRRMELTIFAQSVVLFLSFEVSGLLTMYLFAYPEFDKSVIFVGRRIFDTVYTLASGLSPLFVLITSSDLRKGSTKRGATTRATPQVEITYGERTVAFNITVVVYVLSVVLSLVVNLLVIVLIAKGGRELWKKRFNLLLLFLTLANIVTGISNVVCSFPVVLYLNTTIEPESCTTEVYNYTQTAPYVSFYHLNFFGEQIVQYMSLYIALLRFCVLVLPRMEAKLFSDAILSATLFLIVILSCNFTLFVYVFECAYRFDESFPAFRFVCNKLDEGPEPYHQIYLSQKIGFPAISLLMYLIIVMRMCTWRTETTTHRGELALLTQSLVIFVTFELSSLLTLIYFTKEELDTSTVFLTKRILGTIDTLASLLSPLFVLFTSRDLRQQLWSLLRIKKIVKPIVDSSTIGSSEDSIK